MLCLILAASIVLASAGAGQQSSQLCQLHQNYFFPGQHCHLWGDPHFTTFSGSKHDFQGQQDKHYYYVSLCANYYREDMPFQLAGNNYKWGAGPAQGLYYFTLELFNKNGDINYVYFSTSILGWGSKKQGAVMNYGVSKRSNRVHAMNRGSSNIGDRFRVVYNEDIRGQKCHVYLYVDGCPRWALRVEMHGEYNHIGGEWKMHAVHLWVGDEYKCTACGLCGDFQLRNNQLKDCFGNPRTFTTGMGGAAYAADGWTYEANYYNTVCPRKQGTRDPCAAKRDVISRACDKALRNREVKECCAKLGHECRDMSGDCKDDLCLDIADVSRMTNAEVNKMAYNLVSKAILYEDECQEAHPYAKAEELNVVNEVEAPQQFEVGNEHLVQDKWALQITATDLIIFGLVLVNVVVIAMSVKMCLKKAEKKVAYGLVDGVTTEDDV